MKKTIKWTLPFAATILAACSAIPLSDTAARVIVSKRQVVPAGCKFKGQVVGNQGNFFSGQFTANAKMEEGSMNDIRNKASQLGANYVQLLNSRAGITGSFSGGNSYNSGHSEQTNVTNIGNAYLCPKSKIGL